jgi:hypothetical protein
MTAITETAEIRDWLLGQGENPSRRGQLSKKHVAMYYRAHPEEDPPGLIPGPDASDEEVDAWEDIGDITPDGPEPDGEPPGGGGGGGDAGTGGGAVTVDSGPAHARKGWAAGGKGKTSARKGAARVTAGVRTDINAKISFALEVPGRLWQARDPLCGGVFIAQRPEIADALTDIVCESADLVAFFAGPGGAFMRYLALGAAVMPVVQAVAAHHVYHSIEEQQGDPLAPDYDQYAA